MAWEKRFSDLEKGFLTMEKSFSIMGERFLVMHKTFSTMTKEQTTSSFPPQNEDLIRRVQELEKENRLLRDNQRDNPVSDVVSRQQRHDLRDNGDLGDDDDTQQEVQSENGYVPESDTGLEREEEDMVDYDLDSQDSSDDPEIEDTHQSRPESHGESSHRSSRSPTGESGHITDKRGGEAELSPKKKTLHCTDLNEDVTHGPSLVILDITLETEEKHSVGGEEKLAKSTSRQEHSETLMT
ncbi:hypothetical protein NW762_011191 [Fusarium torreyae]|uniref:Uncharacterized protein n=1 Tax=Fusarium torreyae TaxID=1237075 RepID=A0A9W8VCP3_9HYPO|nr:hypothetical protein NW762_011191 [Fusarium torreyae]